MKKNLKLHAQLRNLFFILALIQWFVLFLVWKVKYEISCQEVSSLFYYLVTLLCS